MHDYAILRFATFDRSLVRVAGDAPIHWSESKPNFAETIGRGFRRFTAKRVTYSDPSSRYEDIDVKRRYDRKQEETGNVKWI